jgi:hypothetical protein
LKTLLLDLESSPNTVFTWGLWKQTISIDKIIDSSEVLCWAAKWLDDESMHFRSKYHGSKKVMLKGMHALLDEADVVVTYNGNSFDLPVLNKEFAQAGFMPPAPYKSVDLCKVVQKKFRFPSSKLEYVCGALGLETKEKHEGFKLWVDCMAGVDSAWRKMSKYNQQDVRILEQLYAKLLPWIPSHPNHATFSDSVCCPSCGSKKFQRRGTAKTVVFEYPRFNCTACGAWFRGSKRVHSERGVGDRMVGVTS